MKNALLIIASVIFSVTGLTDLKAASSQWQDLGGGKARLHANLDPTTNKVQAALEVKLDDGWSTYWRYPGSSGIPPVFDFSGSNGFEAGEIEYPVPIKLGEKELRYAGYKKSVVFPFDGTVYTGVKSDIHLKLLIGICAHVCIPAQAEMKITEDELLRSDPLSRQISTLSKLSVPKLKDASDIVVKRFYDDDGHLMIKVRNKKFSTVPSLFVEGPSNWYLEPAKLIEQSDETALFALNVSRAPKNTDFNSVELRYTLVNGKTGIEFVR